MRKPTGSADLPPTSSDDPCRETTEIMNALAHELRDSLCAIMTAVELMKRRSPLPMAKEHGAIERKAHHLARLVDDFMAMSHLDHEDAEIVRERIQLHEVVAEAVETTSNLLEVRHQTLDARVPVGLFVDGDAVRLTQVFVNLLSNASRYTPMRGHVEVTAAREADAIVARVTDTGSGIAPSILPHVFEPFVRDPSVAARVTGGLGLGLAVVKRLVSLHGGRVWATSAGVGLGSEFVVRLPVALPPSEPRTSTRRKRVASAHRRVLVVEDHDDTGQLLAEFLRSLGHHPVLLHDGPAAIAAARSQHFDVALLDIGLPGMDGFDVAAHLRADPLTRSIRLVAMTGYDSLAHRQRVRDAGFQRLLGKPVDLDALEELLGDELAARGAAG